MPPISRNNTFSILGGVRCLFSESWGCFESWEQTVCIVSIYICCSFFMAFALPKHFELVGGHWTCNLYSASVSPTFILVYLIHLHIAQASHIAQLPSCKSNLSEYLLNASFPLQCWTVFKLAWSAEPPSKMKRRDAPYRKAAGNGQEMPCLGDCGFPSLIPCLVSANFLEINLPMSFGDRVHMLPTWGWRQPVYSLLIFLLLKVGCFLVLYLCYDRPELFVFTFIFFLRYLKSQTYFPKF